MTDRMRFQFWRDLLCLILGHDLYGPQGERVCGRCYRQERT